MIIGYFLTSQADSSALTLEGSVCNTKGRIGIRVTQSGYIGHVYDHSPAAKAGLLEKDVILEADGIKGPKYVDGMAGSIVKLKIKRGTKIFEFDVPRVPIDEIYDHKDTRVLGC